MAFIDSGKSVDKQSQHTKMKNRLNNMDIVQYTLNIPKNVHKKLKIKIAQEGITLRSILIKFLQEYLDKN